LGHESITTTEIYTHLDTDYLRETVMTYHPRNRKQKSQEGEVKSPQDETPMDD